MRLLFDLFQRHRGQSGFANSGLTGNQHDLAFAILGFGPTPPQHLRFFLPSDKRREVATVKGFKPAFHGRRSQCSPDLHRTRESLELLVTKVTQLEQIAQKPSCGVRDNNHLSGSASPCSRAARLGVSPTMPRSWASPDPTRSPTTTSPVAIPTRVCSCVLVFNFATAATRSKADLTALSASSS